MMASKSRISSWLVCAALLATSSNTLADTARVVVGPVVGERAEIARATIRRALTNHPEIERVDDRSLTIASGADAAIVAAARTANANYVVVGEIAPRDAILLLRLRVLRTRDGAVVRTANWELQQLAEITSLDEEIWAQLADYFIVESPAPINNTTTTVATPPIDPARQSSAGNTTVVAEPVKPVAPVASVPAAATTPGLGVVMLSVGAGVSQRFWRMPILGDLYTRGYENAAYPEGRFEAAAFYRFAQQRMGIGLSAMVNVPFSISSRGTAPDGQSVALPTRAVEVYGGATFAMRPAHGGLFRLDAGILYHDFLLDTTALAPEKQLGPMQYLGFRGAAEGVIPIVATGRWEFGILFGAEARVVSTGSAQLHRLFGEFSSVGVGVGGRAGVSVRLDGLLPGLEWRLFAELIRYRSTFSGRAQLGVGSDSVDDYARFQTTLSWAIDTRSPR